jgi:lipopolysaccharide transport system ATP-binding protein
MGTITVTGLGKAYKTYTSRWHRALEWFVPLAKDRHQLKWVLKDVTFSLAPGEAVGIIGLNGAGKSTLLKIITGTTQATTGHVQLTGRVVAMLELGMGFHPDFTGRQNVYSAGQLLGFTAQELDELFPAIEAFSEIGDYIDQPVRVYSSGMQMRLAFSLATAKRPDVLIVDEALSVGDAYFVHKSFDRIKQFREMGTTLLIVSHDKSAIQSICDRAILLAKGTVALQGKPETVMDFYNGMLADKDTSNTRLNELQDGSLQTVSGTGEATVSAIRLTDIHGAPIEVIGVGRTACLDIELTVHRPLDSLVIGYMIKDRLGQTIFGTNTFHLQKVLHQLAAGSSHRFRFRFPVNLGEGTYSISTALHADETHLGANYEWKDLALMFQVINIEQTPFVGQCWIPPEVEVLN